MYRTVNITSIRVRNTHSQFFAGYFAYWKLIYQAESLRKKSGQFALFNTKQKFKAYLELMICYAFAAIIKPLKQFYSYSIYLSGDMEVDKANAVIRKNNLKKVKILKLFGVAFYKHDMKITHEELLKIIGNH